MQVLARWAPTGLSIRLVVHDDDGHGLEGVEIVVHTRDGVPCRLLAGNQGGGVPVDLTRIPAGGQIWMNVEPSEPPGGPVVSLHVLVRDGRTVHHDGWVPIQGGDV